MLRVFAKIATAQNLLRQAADLKDSAIKKIPGKRLAVGALAANTALSLGNAPAKIQEYNRGFY